MAVWCGRIRLLMALYPYVWWCGQNQGDAGHIALIRYRSGSSIAYLVSIVLASRTPAAVDAVAVPAAAVLHGLLHRYVVQPAPVLAPVRALAGGLRCWRVRGWPGKSHGCGLSCRQYCRNKGSNVGESMTERSCWPLPCRTRRTMRALSISVTCNWHSSATRKPAA